MLRKCIGIISYFPDDLKEIRESDLNNLLRDCSTYFPWVDVIIVAQNYKGYIPKSNKNRIILYSYKDKLGITGARKKLREIFINSEYDYLIMMDDDNQILGNTNNNLLEVLENNPDKFICFNWDFGQLYLFTISKSLFKKVEYPELTAENGEIFEDLYLSQICKALCPNYIDSKEINITSKTSGDKSTWWNNSYNLKRMVANTYKLIDSDLKNKYGTIKK